MVTDQTLCHPTFQLIAAVFTVDFCILSQLAGATLFSSAGLKRPCTFSSPPPRSSHFRLFFSLSVSLFSLETNVNEVMVEIHHEGVVGTSRKESEAWYLTS